MIHLSQLLIFLQVFFSRLSKWVFRFFFGRPPSLSYRQTSKRYLLYCESMFFQFFQMGQLLPLLLSRHKWCFWKHGEHFLGVDIYWVVQMFLKWKSNSSNYRSTDRVQRPVFFKLRLITMVEKPMSVCHVYILGRRINSFGRNRTKPSVF